MSYQLRVSPKANAQIRAAEKWWKENRSKAPEAFLDELQKGFELIRLLPTAGEPVPHRRFSGLRRILLARIRYHLYYAQSSDPGIIEILALWHTSRGSAPIL